MGWRTLLCLALSILLRRKAEGIHLRVLWQDATDRGVVFGHGGRRGGEVTASGGSDVGGAGCQHQVGATYRDQAVAGPKVKESNKIRKLRCRGKGRKATTSATRGSWEEKNTFQSAWRRVASDNDRWRRRRRRGFDDTAEQLLCNRRETGRELCGLRIGARRRRSRLIMDRSGSAGRQASWVGELSGRVGW